MVTMVNINYGDNTYELEEYLLSYMDSITISSVKGKKAIKTWKKEVIDEYSVYSMNTADEMSKNISKFSNSNYGIGITGKLNRQDINNMSGEDNIVYISVYDRDNDSFYNKKVTVIYKTREENKQFVIDNVIELLGGIL